ncbi:MAG: O-antigen ligase family protein [Candidatus Promineifilaceae bacterium]
MVRWYFTGRPGIHTPFDWPFLAFIVTAGVSVWAAFDRQSAWGKFWLICGAVLLYYSFANWAADKGSRALQKQAWILAGLAPLIAIYFFLSHDWDEYPSKIGLISETGKTIRHLLPALSLERFHPNILAGAMAMLLPFTVGVTIISWYRKRRRDFIAGLGAVILTLFGLALSGSRGAWIAVIVAALVVIWWLVIRSIVPGRRRSRSWFLGSIAVVLLLVAVVVILAPDLVNDSLSGLPSLGSGLLRADMYRNSLILVNDYPFIGAGLDNYMMLYSSYALLLHVGFSTHAHNLFLDLTIQQGIIAVFIFFWMLVLMGEAVWRVLGGRRVRNQTEPAAPEKASKQMSKQGVLLGAAAMSILILVIHGFVDDAIYGTRMVVLMFVPFAFAVPELLRARTPDARQQFRAIFVGLLIVGIILIFSWRPVLSLFNSNLAAVRQGQAELGVYEWPDWPVQDAVRSEVDLSSAVDGYERAISLNPGNASARRRLGQILLSLGEYGEAVRHLEAAYAQAPWDNATRQLLGEAYLVNGRVDDGVSLWSKTNNDQGQLQLRAGWYSYIDAREESDIVRATANMYK